MKKIRYGLIVVFILLIGPVVFNLLKPGFFVTDDGGWMVIRFSAFYQELREGQFPVRYLTRLNNGYGYPVATFLYPGFMYAAVIPKVLGLSFVASIKAVMVASVIGGALFVYRWIRESMSPLAGLFGVAVYLYHPYLLWDIYSRGSVGEVLALAIVPYGLWAISRRNKLAIALAYGLLILAHNTYALLFVPVLLIYHALIEPPDMHGFAHTLRWVGGTLLLGLGVSAFFWIPVIAELPNTVFADTTISTVDEYFVGSGVGSSSLLGSFGIVGIGHIILVSMSLVLLAVVRLYRSRQILFLTGVFLIALLFSIDVSAPLWETLPLGRYIQFPFRFLGLGVITTPYIAAAFFDQALPSMRAKYVSLVVGSVLLGVASYSYSVPSEFTNFGDSYYSTNQATTTVRNEYMPKWAVLPPSGAAGQISRVSAETVQINTIYWPGYSVRVGNDVLAVTHDTPEGFMQVATNADPSTIELIFRETPTRLIADLISALSIGYLVVITIRNKRSLIT